MKQLLLITLVFFPFALFAQHSNNDLSIAYKEGLYTKSPPDVLLKRNRNASIKIKDNVVSQDDKTIATFRREKNIIMRENVIELIIYNHTGKEVARATGYSYSGKWAITIAREANRQFGIIGPERDVFVYLVRNNYL